MQPVARFDIVPYQRIENGTTFKAGVVAFSKPGITSVVFTISGCGYASGTKTATEMTLNDRTNVWEYWVSIPTSEFSSNGNITISAVVTDGDGNTRNLDAITLRMDQDGTLARQEAWVDGTSGDDGTGTSMHTRSPDSSSESTQSLGDPKIVLVEGADNMGEPEADSPLLNMVPSPKVPVDVNLVERGRIHIINS